MENDKDYKTSAECSLHQPTQHSRIPRKAKALFGNLSLGRLLFEDDHELGRALQRCFSSADICADQSAQAPLEEHPRGQIIRAWRSRCQRVAFVANPSSALAALKDRFPRLGSLSQRLSTNTYRAGALTVVVLSLLLVGFAVEHAVSADHNRNNTAKSEQSSTTAWAQQNALIDESLVAGAPDVGPLVAESASQFDYTLAFILNDTAPMLFAENRNYGANSAIPQSGGAASASGSAVAQPLLASLGGVGGVGGIGPSGVPAAPREVAVVPVPETGASSCLLLGLAFVLIYLTIRLLDAHSERRSG
jgi:hypothetical protein